MDLCVLSCRARMLPKSWSQEMCRTADAKQSEAWPWDLEGLAAHINHTARAKVEVEAVAYCWLSKICFFSPIWDDLL